MTARAPASPAAPPAWPAAAPAARLPRQALLVLAATAAWIVVTELLPAGVLTGLSASLHVPPGRAGLLASAYGVAATVAAIPFTALTRRLSRRPLLLAGVGGLAATSALTAVSPSFRLALAARLAGGLLNGMVWSLLASYAARIAPDGQRGRAVTIVLSGITVALVAGLPASTALAGLAGWRAVFAGLAVTGVLLAGWARLAVPAAPGEPPGPRAGLATVARRPGLRPVLGGTLLLVAGHQALYTYIAPVAARAGLRQPGLPLLVFGVAAALGIAVTGMLPDRRHRPALLAATALLVLASGVLALAGRDPAAVLAAAAVWGAGFGAAPALLQAALTRAAGTRYAPVASSFQTTVYNAGIAAGALAGGTALDHLGPAAVPWTALPLLAAALAVLAVRPGGASLMPAASWADP
jgi:predicted MFS family arabinose efflux permease